MEKRKEKMRLKRRKKAERNWKKGNMKSWLIKRKIDDDGDCVLS